MPSDDLNSANHNQDPTHYIGLLVNELAIFKNQNIELTNALAASVNEVKSLHAKINMLQEQLNNFPKSDLSRKIPKKASNFNNVPTAENEGTMDADFTLVPSKVNKKKIIQAIDTSLNVIKGHIKQANCNNFNIKQSRVNGPIKISINKTEEIPLIRLALQNAKISFHEFKWESEKSKCYLIKGLVGVTDSDLPFILNELVKAGVPEEVKLSLLTTGYMKSHPDLIHNSLVRMVVPPNFDNNVLKNINFIDHVAVKFELFKSKSIVQCKNCQRFGHSASGCQHLHRCVKCGNNHLRDTCPRTFNKAIKLVCCNCGGEHSANNLSACSYFQENFARAPSISTPNPTMRNATASQPKLFTSAKVNGSSYAATIRKSSASATQNSADVTPLNVKSSNMLVDLNKKMDLLLSLVNKHEVILQNICSNG